MAQQRILTRAQQVRHEEEQVVLAEKVEDGLAPVLRALTNLVQAPEVADMIIDVVLGGNGKKGSTDGWNELRLTAKGLVFVTGHWESGSEWTDSGQYETDHKVEPSMELIHLFRLTEASLIGLLHELKA